MEIAQIICNCMFWLITIYLVMLMATKLKTLVCVGTYMILYIIMNLMSYMDGIKYLSPLHYIVAVSSNTLLSTFSTMIFFLYTICMGILFTHIGIRRIEKWIYKKSNKPSRARPYLTPMKEKLAKYPAD